MTPNDSYHDGVIAALEVIAREPELPGDPPESLDLDHVIATIGSQAAIRLAATGMKRSIQKKVAELLSTTPIMASEQEKPASTHRVRYDKHGYLFMEDPQLGDVIFATVRGVGSNLPIDANGEKLARLWNESLAAATGKSVTVCPKCPQCSEWCQLRPDSRYAECKTHGTFWVQEKP